GPSLKHGGVTPAEPTGRAVAQVWGRNSTWTHRIRLRFTQHNQLATCGHNRVSYGASAGHHPRGGRTSERGQVVGRGSIHDRRARRGCLDGPCRAEGARTG